MENYRTGRYVLEILVAEDNPADVYLIREAMRTHGVDCHVRIATDGQQVLQLLATAKPPAEREPLDLIILDLNLPRHDGIEILQILKEKTRLPVVPVVVLTSSDSPRERQVAAQLGVVRFLQKPSSLDQFLSLGAVFRELLEQSCTPRQPPA